MITIRDVARQAGVSVATVSRVLNNSALVSPETREAVMKAVTQRLSAECQRPGAGDAGQRHHRRGGDGCRTPFWRAGESGGYRPSSIKYVLIGNSYHEAEKERHAIEVLIRQRCNADCPFKSAER
jgi:LacI family transcriptional regulator